MVSERRKARIITLQALYELDSVEHEPEAVLARLLDRAAMAVENGLFVRELVNGVILYRGQIDEKISCFAPSWPLEQLPVIDRNILRLAIFELLFDNRVSVKIAINEAVELAKRFGNDHSASFVNGVLGSVSALAGR